MQRWRPAWFLLFRLAAQNVGRRLLRSVFLGLAVMIAVGVGFSGFVLGWALSDGVSTCFSRMGADLVIVPRGALVNITSTLLTVQPTEFELDAELLAKLRATPGVAKVAPQRLVRAGVESGAINLIAYDPELDFTVESWLPRGERISPDVRGVLVGERVAANPGETLIVCGHALSVVGRLGRTGVGPFDESYFVSLRGLDELLAAAQKQRSQRPGGRPVNSQAASAPSSAAHLHEGHQNPAPAACLPEVAPQRVSAFLLQLSAGASLEQASFAIGQIPDIKIIAGNPVFTAARQSLGSLLLGAAIFAALLMLALSFVVSLLFSAIVQERRREIGVLRAMGARLGQVMSITLIEATLITGFGGVLGVGFGFCLIFLSARSLGFYFASLGVPFDGPPQSVIWVAAVVSVLCGAALGVVGALIAGWRAHRLEPYAMIQMDNAQ